MCRINRPGAAAVEFALVAPVFFLMVFGMIEFGRMVMVQQVITNASREGARIAIVHRESGGEVSDADVSDEVNSYLEGARLSGADVTVDRSDPNKVAVTVRIPFGQVSWLPSPMFIGRDTVLTATSAMRQEPVRVP